MASFFTPKAMGEFVGKVKEIKNHCFSVASLAAFCNGDGLCYIMDGKLIGFRINKVEGNRLYPLTMPVGLRPGLKLYRNHDQAFLSVLSKPSAQRKIDISMELQLSTEPSVSMLQLIVTDEHGHQGSANIECGNQIAQKPQEENIKRQLLRLGDTPYECVSIDMPDHLPFIPSSLLSQLRRNAIQALSLNVNGDNCGNDNGNEGNHEAHADVAHEAPVPHYDSEELYNAANRDSKEFYRRYGIDAKAFEQDGGAVVMQCRYCLRHELGYCTKQGKKASWKEPLTISIDNGKTFQLHFDCKKCEMTVNTI